MLRPLICSVRITSDIISVCFVRQQCHWTLLRVLTVTKMTEPLKMVREVRSEREAAAVNMYACCGYVIR